MISTLSTPESLFSFDSLSVDVLLFLFSPPKPRKQTHNQSNEKYQHNESIVVEVVDQEEQRGSREDNQVTHFSLSFRYPMPCLTYSLFTSSPGSHGITRALLRFEAKSVAKR